MSLMTKIKSFLYALPIGMKAAEDEIMVQKMNSTSNTVGAHEVIQQNSLGVDLLKGEVTQQVEEMRYRTYLVNRESDKYKYVCGERAIKEDNVQKSRNTVIQNNKIHCNSITDELNIKLNGYQINIGYEDIPRFRLEQFIDYIEFEVGSEPRILLKFDKNLENSDPISRSFINSVKSFPKILQPTDWERYEYFRIPMLSFTTFKAQGEDDMVNYTLHNLTLDSFISEGNTIVLKYIVSYYKREDLMDKYYSPTMDEKYKTKTAKNPEYSYNNTNQRKRVCSVCGKDISVYDGDLTEATFGKSMCHDCLIKYFEEESKNANRN